MTERIFTLTVPIEAWEAASFVPAAASEAVALGNHLKVDATTVDVLSGQRLTSVTTPASFDVSATLLWSTGPRSFATATTVTVTAMAETGQLLAQATVRATTTWRSGAPVEVLPDTGQTFAIAFGALEPIDRAARAIESTFALLGIDVLVAPGPTLAGNRAAVRHMSAQPPMASDLAEPMNPYALEGIPGAEAEVWAQAGYPAADAAEWKRAGFDAHTALDWIESGLSVTEAQAWDAIEVDPSDAEALSRAGFPPGTAEGIALDGFHPAEIVPMLEAVPAEDVGAWMEAMEESDLLDAVDVPTFVRAGLSPNDVLNAPENLTALQIIRHVTGDAGQADDTGYDTDEDYDDVEIYDDGEVW